MNYNQALTYIENIGTLGSVPGLASIKELCRRLGNPQDELSFVHIAGTNGKGSVLAFISTALISGGYKTGRYISPVIRDYRERFQVQNKWISKVKAAKYITIVGEAADNMEKEGLPHPTAFEVETAAAFLYFRDSQCDVVVLETGMGGRLDATNLIQTTLLSVITPVSMDHMSYLGSSIEAITEEKAGICRKGVPIVTLQPDGRAARLLKARAEEWNCPYVEVDAAEISSVKYGLNKQSFSYKTYKNMKITLAGRYQLQNAALALEALLQLEKQGLFVKREKLQKAFLETTWEGRLSIIGHRPLFIIDGAHNEAAARELAASIELYFTNRRLIYIMGVLRDKEYEKIIQLTASYAEQILTVAPPYNDRALSAYELARTVRRYHKGVTALDSLEEAVEMSYLLAKEDTVILAFGSLSFLGELTEIVENRKLLRRDTHGKSREN